MELAYTLVWTDYNDNLDDHRGLIQKCLDNKNCEELWEKADEWYSDAEWEAVREIIAKLKRDAPYRVTLTRKMSMTSSTGTRMKSAMRYTTVTTRMC